MTNTEQSWEEYFWWLTHDMLPSTNTMGQLQADVLAYMVIDTSKTAALDLWKDAADKSKATFCGQKDQSVENTELQKQVEELQKLNSELVSELNSARKEKKGDNKK